MHISAIKYVQCIASGNIPYYKYLDAIQRQIIYASIVLFCQLSIVLLHLVEAYHMPHKDQPKTSDHPHTYYCHA